MKINRRISILKHSAQSRGLEVRLMKHEYEQLLQCGCMYCGKYLLDQGGACLDRIDSDKGYTLDNVTPCCKRCNVAKNDMNISEFIDWVERVYKFTQQKIQDVSISPQYTYQDEKKLLAQKKDKTFIGVK